ncbi:MAG: histidinol-phosphate aminotransferase family protein [Halobacteriovoraceae bacterium]|jgi:histidinol-phosphate aminotransferase|nr:histidinol-phosphate aminotransferase family protein [Halobacteriovoraceae bacterium]MBT5095260.1 histidinol-phosphate aminotransferase family protein [Halobacteriovoraceae bacterium]
MKKERKEHLLKLERKRAGTYRKEVRQGLYLDRNERSIPYPKEVMDQLGERLKACEIHRYPEVEELYQAISQWLKVSSSQILITEGVSGAIKSLLETEAEVGDNILFPGPTFALYPVYADMFQVEPRSFGYTKDHKFDLEQLKSKIDQKTAFVFLPNPNVPIEGGISLEQISELADYCLKTNTTVVLDEVYFPFGGPDGIPLIEKHSNLLIMRSFSKAFGLAGIRVGYLIGREKDITYFSKMRTGYESNRLCIETVKFFIENESVVKNYISEVKKSFALLKSFFDQKKISYTGGDWSNFLYVFQKTPAEAQSIVAKLKEKNIHVRGGWSAPYDHGFSITGAPEKEIKTLISALEEIL